MMGPHKNLVVWQRSIVFVTAIYKYTQSFPKIETYGLTDQLRRAAISIASNIAEGYGRSTNVDLIHFLHMSLGSSNEIDTQLEVARNLGYLSEEDYTVLDKENEELNKMIRSLIYIRNNSNQ